MEYYYIENPELIIKDSRDWHNIDEFDFNIVSNLPSVKCIPKSGERKRKRYKESFDYVDAIGTFDLENTKLPGREQGVVFLFQFCLLIKGDYYFFGFRTYEKLKYFFYALSSAVIPRVLNIWDFNFGYEYSYLIGAFEFTDNKNNVSVFFKDRTHPLCAFSHHGAFHWRDAQALFGQGKLADHTKGLKWEKLSGELDYTKKRFHFTPIEGNLAEKDEIGYCIADVFGLAERIEKELTVLRHVSQHGVPFTVTGYIRKSVNRIFRKYREDGWPYDWHDAYPKALYEED